MKTVAVAIVGMVVSLACLVTAQVRNSQAAAAQQVVSASSQPAAAVAKEEAPRKGAWVGTVVSVDSSSRKISVKDEKGATREFLVGTVCRIIKKGKKTLDSIKENESVIVNYDGDEAKIIHVGGKKKAVKKAAKKEPAAAPTGQTQQSPAAQPAKDAAPVGP